MRNQCQGKNYRIGSEYPVMEAEAMHISHDFHLAHLMHLCYDGAILFSCSLGLAMSVAFIAFGLELISSGF